MIFICVLPDHFTFSITVDAEALDETDGRRLQRARLKEQTQGMSKGKVWAMHEKGRSFRCARRNQLSQSAPFQQHCFSQGYTAMSASHLLQSDTFRRIDFLKGWPVRKPVTPISRKYDYVLTFSHLTFAAELQCENKVHNSGYYLVLDVTSSRL